MYTENKEETLVHPLEDVTVALYKARIAAEISASGAFEERTGLFRSGRDPIFIGGNWEVDMDTILTLATKLNPDMIVGTFDRNIGSGRYAIILVTTPDGFNEYRSLLTTSAEGMQMGEWRVFTLPPPDGYGNSGDGLPN